MDGNSAMLFLLVVAVLIFFLVMKLVSYYQTKQEEKAFSENKAKYTKFYSENDLHHNGPRRTH